MTKPLAVILCAGCDLLRTFTEFAFSKELRFKFCLNCRNRGESRKLVKL